METKSVLKFIIVLICLLTFQTQVYGQPQEHRPMPPVDRAEQLQKDLNLSEAQNAKMKTILEEQKTEMEKLIKALEDTHMAMMKKKKETEEKIADLLDSKQKEKFEEIQKHHHNRPDEQRDDQGQPPMPQADRPPMPGPVPQEEFVKDLKNELKLTSEQETSIKKIFEVQSAEMKKERETMREKMEKQQKETDAKFSTVLTDDQKKKFEELQKKNSQKPPCMPKPENENDRPMHEECPDHQE